MQIYKKAKQLVKQKYSIFIRQILDHNSIKKNKKADKATKKAARRKKV